jgi:predicted ATP-binding protein involved in virulence
MRLDRLTVKNFRCYEEQTFNFHPNVNLIVGQNAAGKTAVLDAAAVAIATWLLGFKQKNDKKGLDPSDATLSYVEQEGEAQFVEAWPVVVSATGMFAQEEITWERSKETPTGNTRYGNAVELTSLAKALDKQLAEEVALPLISYYGTMRLGQDPKSTKSPLNKTKPFTTAGSYKPSRLDGYQYSVDPRIATKKVIAWFEKQEWQSYQQGKEPTMLGVVRNAILGCIKNASNIRYDPKRKELIVFFNDGKVQPFMMLSDGQRSILSLVGDIAQKAATLNPYMGEDVLHLTEGVVLIDELDLHLHPRWQRGLIEDLRTTFPKIQFICTSHSPFLIQSLRSSEELIMLDGQPTAELANKTIEDIAAGIMSINNPEVSDRYAEMKGVATEYLKDLNNSEDIPEVKLAAYKDRLADSLAPYADNPAFQAFLEMQRIAKLGS